MRIEATLLDYLEETYSHARLRCNRIGRSREAVLANILAEAEAAGDAMRYIDPNGRIAWKATPQLREHLTDLKADAKADADEVAQ